MKSLAVSLPLTDLNKRKALKEKTGFDVDKALVHIEEEKEEEKAPAAPATERRVKEAKKEEAAPARRTTSNYKVVNKAE